MNLKDALTMARAGFPHGACPDGFADCNAARVIAEAVAIPEVLSREFLGRAVREQWVRWAKSQPSPKPSWLAPYDELSEADKEADRQIGEHIYLLTKLYMNASAGDAR
jgi:hypothetical protein